MALPWIRLDTTMPDNPKILGLLAERDGHRAAFVWVCCLTYCGKHGTDGFIPRAALPMIHGTAATARLLEKYGLWDEVRTGWQIHNFEKRQSLSAAADLVRQSKVKASIKGNCVRHHGAECGCWKEAS